MMFCTGDKEKKGQALAEAKRRTACDATLAIAEGRMLSVLKLRSFVAMAGAVIGAAAKVIASDELQSWRTVAIPFKLVT